MDILRDDLCHIRKKLTDIESDILQSNHVKRGVDRSVVTRWTVDQEVVGSHPTHGGH